MCETAELFISSTKAWTVGTGALPPWRTYDGAKPTQIKKTEDSNLPQQNLAMGIFVCLGGSALGLE